jgi:hypothetical protein
MNSEGQKVLFVISNNPFSKDRRTICELIRNLLSLGAKISVFLHGNGIWWLGSSIMEEFASKGVEILYGTESVKKRSVNPPPWAKGEKLETLAELITSSDKVLFFN